MTEDRGKRRGADILVSVVNKGSVDEPVRCLGPDEDRNRQKGQSSGFGIQRMSLKVTPERGTDRRWSRPGGRAAEAGRSTVNLR